MVAFGKSIRIYLADGTPAGIRHAELVNWTGQAMVCPRARIGELSDWSEASRPGVYFLVGDSEGGTRPTVYIGEAENVLARLQSHVKNKDFWTRVTFFTSKDDNLTKAHVKYLEARLVGIALDAGRAELQNGNAPQMPALPRADRDAMEEFLEPIRVLLGTLGLSILQKLPSGIAPDPGPATGGSLVGQKLYFNPKRDCINATGAISDEGFIVFAESTGDAKVRHHLGKGWLAHREQLIAEGTIEAQGDKIQVKKDVLFTSPSAAAAILAGGNYNGREAWKDSSGVSLKELEEGAASDGD